MKKPLKIYYGGKEVSKEYVFRKMLVSEINKKQKAQNK